MGEEVVGWMQREKVGRRTGRCAWSKRCKDESDRGAWQCTGEGMQNDCAQAAPLAEAGGKGRGVRVSNEANAGEGGGR